MKYLHVRTDSTTGRSAQEITEPPIAAVTPYEGHAPLGVSAWNDAKRAIYFEAPSGWAPGWHPAPCRRLVLVQRGAAEIETGDGKKSVLRAGDYALFADTAGAGHHTRVLSGEPWTGLAVDF
jgi:hypothetical protein